MLTNPSGIGESFDAAQLYTSLFFTSTLSPLSWFGTSPGSRGWRGGPRPASARPSGPGSFWIAPLDWSNTAVAVKRGVTLTTVGKWRQRFLDGRLGALGAAPRSGQPRKLTDAKVEAVITRTLETRPKNATQLEHPHHSPASGLNQSAIVRIWRAFGLKPHLQENFKLSTDAFFVEKVRDIVGLYLNPPEQTRAVVLCVDEKSRGQALDRSQPVLPMRPGQARAPHA